MADAMETLKGILGDGAEDKIKNVMDSLSAGGGNSGGLDSGSLEYILQMKDLIGKLSTSHNDPRSNLLMSLRPYMRTSRQSSIDSAVKLLNLSKLAMLFK